MEISRVILFAMLMGCLVAGVPLPSENPSAEKDSVEAREAVDLTVHRLDADEAIPAAEVAADIAAQSEIFSGDNVPAVDRNQPTNVRQFGVAIPELKLTQFQRSDDEGRYSFGYAYPEQVRMESRSEDGVVTGSYFYTDPNGVPNQVQYLADGDGFRVAANNLPVFYPGNLPEPVQDTPEVLEAKRKHLETWSAIAKQNLAQTAKDEAIKRVEAATTVEDNRDAVITDALAADEVEAAMELFRPFSSSKIEQDFDNDKQPSIKPLDPDVIIDDENQAIITEQDEDVNAGIFEIDAEPIRLLAQLYAKHVQDNAEPPQAIERPVGFHPQNLLPPSGFDLFSRAEGDDRQAIEITNPEFVDLRAFLLTNRFRNNPIPQIFIQAEDKLAKPSKFDDNISDDLLTSEEPDPADSAFDGQYGGLNELYNYYFNIAGGGEEETSPVVALPVNRETLNNLPESLKLALSGAVAIDGHHNAQSMPSQQVQLKQHLLNQQRFASNYFNYPHQQQPYYSPYSSFYSPYYYYRQSVAQQYNPYSYHTSPYYRLPSSRPYSVLPYNYSPYYSY